jgi:hypothetical protein
VWRSSSSTSAVKQTGFVSATASDGCGMPASSWTLRRLREMGLVGRGAGISAVGQCGCGEGQLCD